MTCEAGKKYLRDLDWRNEYEANNLAEITGWDIDGIRDRINSPETEFTPWTNELWN